MMEMPLCLFPSTKLAKQATVLTCLVHAYQIKPFFRMIIAEDVV
jgi:hypothetical protein